MNVLSANQGYQHSSDFTLVPGSKFALFALQMSACYMGAMGAMNIVRCFSRYKPEQMQLWSTERWKGRIVLKVTRFLILNVL